MKNSELRAAIERVWGFDLSDEMLLPNAVTLCATKLFVDGDVQSPDARIIRDAMFRLEKYGHFNFEVET